MMKRLKHISIFMVFIQVCVLCFAQRAKIDSLNSVLLSLKDSARVDCLNALSIAHVYYKTDSAGLFAQHALEEAEKIHYKKGMAGAWLNLAWATGLAGGNLITMENYCRNSVLLLENTGDIKQLADAWFSLACTLSSQCKFKYSLEAFNRAGSLFSQAGDELALARVYNYMGDDERNRGQYNKSLEYALKWHDIASKYDNKSHIDVWASLYAVVGDYETALDYYSQGYEIAKASRKIDYELIYLTRMKGEMFLLQGKYDSARHYFELAIHYPQQPPLDLQWGKFYLARRKYDSALLHLNDALTQSKNINNLSEVQPVLLNLCMAHKESGNPKMAMRYARELLETSKRTGARQHTRDAHLMLYQLFAQSGDKDSAFSHLQKYTLLKDTIDKDLSAQQLAFYRIKSEKEKDQARIDMLNKEKKVHQLQLAQTAQQKKFLIVGIAILLITGVALFSNILLKRKYEKQRMQYKLDLQHLESEIEAQQVLLNERLRISRELHDDIGSTLGSISIYSEVAKKRIEKNENTGEVLSKIGAASRESIDKMSDIVWSLNPGNEGFEQLQNRMMAFAAMTLVPLNIIYDFCVDERLKNIQFKGDQRKNLFLIFKEALHNIVKYADCKTVHIRLAVDNNNLVLVIKDDGKGFDTLESHSNANKSRSEYSGGNGIKNMHARAGEMQAKLCIDSKINEGTTIQLGLPL